MEQVFCNQFSNFEIYNFEHEKMQLLLLYCLFLLQMDETWNHVYFPCLKIWCENKFYNNLQDKNVFSDIVVNLVFEGSLQNLIKILLLSQKKNF